MGRGRIDIKVDEYGFKRNYVDLWENGSREQRDELELKISWEIGKVQR